MTTFQRLHQTAPETKGRGDYANLKESSLTWTIMLVLSRIELTPSIFKAPNLTRPISILFFFSKIFLHTIINRKENCSISSRSRVLAHRPCPKLEMFCPSVLQLFYRCSKVLMTNHVHGMSSLFLFFVFQTGWRSELSYPSPWPCESGLTI